jgi:hypothetical protein
MIPSITRRRVLHAMTAASAIAGVALPFRVHAAEAALGFGELYAKQSVLGLELSDKARGLAGRKVKILGYLAPPLKPDITFFVLTRAPVALCPFCNSDADWPSDIVVVYPHARLDTAQDGLPVAVTGTLELGSRRDPQTGFLSLVRVVDAEFSVIR